MLNKIINENLEYVKQIVQKTSTNKQNILLVMLITTIFTIILFYVYNNFIRTFLDKKHALNKEFINDDNDSSNDVLVLFFYTEWCPYCKQSLIELD